MRQELLDHLKKSLDILGIKATDIALDHPEGTQFGDYSSNVAMVYAKELKTSPRELADKIIAAFEDGKPAFVKSASVAGPGFINFFLDDQFVARASIATLASVAPRQSGGRRSDKIMVEYTDPNPFKEFHIGHLMSNTIGESIARILEDGGSEVIRANWQGDVGPHVAKAIWGALKSGEGSGPAYWGKAYTRGAQAYDEGGKAKTEIDEINKKVYARSDEVVNMLYDRGRKESLDAFEEIYARLGTKFDNYFFEGTEGRNGEAIVRDYEKKGVFEESQGAIIFPGEKHGLHTRVFITSHGLPTYETKELGLNREKFKLYPDLSQSIIITANEQNDYFKVLLKVFSLIEPDIAAKTRHFGHGMMRRSDGKMSSRKGNIVTATSLLDEIREMVLDKMKEREFLPDEADSIADMVAVASVKYTVLRQSIGSDIIFDTSKSISFEGDSGPYLQYSAVRAGAVLEKARAEHIADVTKLPEVSGHIEKLLIRYEDVVERARHEYAPQLIATYLINLAGAFNSFYASQVIVDKKDELSPYRVALTKKFQEIMTRGLWLLGIKVPAKM